MKELKPPESPQLNKSEFVRRLEGRWQLGNFVCVGLDTDYTQIPDILKRQGMVASAMLEFNREIFHATHDLVCAYKLNSAFYEAQGEDGSRALRRTISLIKDQHPDIPVILDAKRADIGKTNNGYVMSAFDELRADAITVHPYLGKEALKPFLDREDKGIIVLARTSNPGAGEFQDLIMEESHEPLYLVVAKQVAQEWNDNGNCAVVAGATYPQELAQIRAVVGDMPILIPGIGTQGGDLEASVAAGKDSRGWGMIINSSSGIIFNSRGGDFAQAARNATEQLRDNINSYR